MDDSTYKRRVEYGVAAVVLLIGLFFVYQASTIATSRETIGPRTMPMFLAVALLIGGLWIALRAYLGRVGAIQQSYGFRDSNVRRIFLVIGCGTLFVFLFWGFGYFTAIVITFVTMLYAFGVRNILGSFVAGLILAALFQMLFMGVMLLNDPKGRIIDMRPMTNWLTGTK